MSKTLLMIRHGKSSWDAPGLSDHERPLLKLGIERTKRMAHFLSEKRVVPDLIISSHAVRAFETAKVAGKRAGLSKKRNSDRAQHILP
jgi:phosphohistidine phosphatase